tara:strand:- start:87394 stop:90603 length:3210 start_codon:yes stop_codon:yes gene_type:complete
MILMPKVTVILTSFNHAKYLRQAIGSVLNQSYQDFELIIWDDASADNSWEIIQSYRDPRILAYKNDKSRRGVYGINKSISEIAKGEYIAIHHSDDEWHPDKLNRQIDYLQKNPECGAVFTNVLAIDEQSEVFADKAHYYSTIFDQPNRSRYEWLNFFFTHGNALCHPSVLIRKECYLHCGLYRLGLAQTADFDMWIRLCFKYDIHVLPEKLTLFRIRNGERNTSGGNPDARSRMFFEHYTVLKNYFRIKSYEEFISIFPEENNPLYSRKFERNYALAMTLLKSRQSIYTNFMALELFFELLNDPEKYQLVKETYGFDYLNLVDLSKKYGISERPVEEIFELEKGAQGFSILQREYEELSKAMEVQSQELQVITNENIQLKRSFISKLVASFRSIRPAFKYCKPHLVKIFKFLGLYPVASYLYRGFRRRVHQGSKKLVHDFRSVVHRIKGSNQSEEIPKIVFDETKDTFYSYTENPPLDPMVKLIAFYLPQFHPFPENDEWWGKGFTEWSNVGKAVPNYEGHYQPHCPIHLGYYDLRIPEIMEEQARLARNYGISGFSYYFYWFAGKTLMESPLEMMLNNPKVDIPFCLTWANENWTRRWDGLESDVLIAQDHSEQDSLNFIRHLVKYFKDDRYICIDGKPVLIVYRPDIIPQMRETLDLWREEITKHGFPGIYLISAMAFDNNDPGKYGFEAAVEFPPHTVEGNDVSHEQKITNPDFNGGIYCYDHAVEAAVKTRESKFKKFRTAMLSWDNTARKQDNGHIFSGFSLLKYKQWLASLCNHCYRDQRLNQDEKLVFINAWNEWAEGTHLEPDRKYGYGYLQSTYDVISNYDSRLLSRTLKHKPVRKNDFAVVLHVHYDELWPEISQNLSCFEDIGFDLFVTVTSKKPVAQILAEFPDADIDVVENRGRDILPFIRTMKRIESLGYIAVCKLHSKRTIYRQDGDQMRQELLGSLVGSKEIVSEITRKFKEDEELGLVVPENYLMPHNDYNMASNHELVLQTADLLGMKFVMDTFPAGSMYWVRPEAIKGLLKLDSSNFGVERGLADGTLPHAVERLIGTMVKENKYFVECC